MPHLDTLLTCILTYVSIHIPACVLAYIFDIYEANFLKENTPTPHMNSVIPH